MLQVGDMAPDFTLPNQDDEKISLKDFAGKWLVLYFYPKAMTPGCTTQACALRDNMDDLTAIGAVAVGVSPDSPKRMKKFIERDNLNFMLLGDESHTMLEAYDVWKEKSMYGRKYMGVMRQTYIISPDGKICYTMEKVKPAAHHEEVINWLKENAVKGAAA